MFRVPGPTRTLFPAASEQQAGSVANTRRASVKGLAKQQVFKERHPQGVPASKHALGMHCVLQKSTIQIDIYATNAVGDVPDVRAAAYTLGPSMALQAGAHRRGGWRGDLAAAGAPVQEAQHEAVVEAEREVAKGNAAQTGEAVQEDLRGRRERPERLADVSDGRVLHHARQPARQGGNFIMEGPWPGVQHSAVYQSASTPAVVQPEFRRLRSLNATGN